MTEPLLLTATQISTFLGTQLLTKASGFYFERDERLYLVTSRHVLIDEPSPHLPDRIEIELHMDEVDLTRSTGFSVLLYRDGKSIWHQGEDSGGDIDVAVIELERAALPDRGQPARVHAGPPADLAGRSRSGYRRCSSWAFRSASTTRCTTCRWCARRRSRRRSACASRARATF